MPNDLESSPRAPARRHWRVVVPVALLLLLAFWWLRRDHGGAGEGATFAARRGPLDIQVTVGGSVQALESQEVKCEVRVGYQGIKILKIVEEGYQVTDEDIRTNKVLVELDSGDLQKQIVQQDIAYESALASLTDGQQAFDIQVNQNLSDIKAAEQKARFARMDFDKYLGEQVTQEIIDRVGIEKDLCTALTNVQAEAAALATMATNSLALSNGPVAALSLTNSLPKPSSAGALATITTNSLALSNGPVAALSLTNGLAKPSSAATLAPTATNNLALSNGPVTGLSSTNSPRNPPGAAAEVGATPKGPAGEGSLLPQAAVDFTKYTRIEALGDGEAKQKLRKADDDLQVAQKEAGQAQATLEGTRRLFSKGFVTKIEQERDELAYVNSQLKVKTAETARDLLVRYEFVKTAEETLSKYAEAARELVRARKAAISKLAQAEAKLKMAQGQFNIQSRQRQELYDQLEKCQVKATKPGLVVYGSGRDDMYWGGEERVREGATVRERQSLFTIPDMTRMSARVKIHESYIKLIKKGQKARITVDAFPDKVLTGEVSKVGVLPDSQNRWLNPDLKVYLTTISVEGTNEWLKPGMSAKVEIQVDRLPDVVYVPMQAVTPANGKHVCYVGKGAKPDRREVETGQFNDEFIEIKKGLKEGEFVLLRPLEREKSQKPEDQPEKPPETKPVPPPRPPAAPASLPSRGSA